jgi:hypothetical protein
MKCLLLSTLLLLTSAAAVSGDAAASNAIDAHVQDMVAWLRNQGGHFNEKLQIRRVDPSDPTSYFGVFATESIQSMEPLMSVPASSMIRATIQQKYAAGLAPYHAVLCDLTHVLLKELKLGEKSHFAPYVKYLLGQERGQIPATWTEPAKQLLREIVFPSADKHELTDWIEDFERDGCIEPGNAFEQQALAMVVQRGWDDVLIPIYDVMNQKISMRTTPQFAAPKDCVPGHPEPLKRAKNFFLPTTTAVIAMLFLRAGAPRKSFVILDL